MFKSFQDTSALQQFHGFPNLNMQQATSAYGFSGVTFWLDAAYGLNTQTNLGAVSRWQARVGDYVFEQTTAANQPRLLTSSSSYNNLPVVDFFDNARFMTSPVNIPFNSTIVFVANYDSLNAQNAVIGNATNTAHIGLGGSGTGYNGVYATNNDAAIPGATGTTDTTSVKIAALTRNSIYVNGVEEWTGNFDWIGAFRVIGRGSGASNRALIGKISEILIYSFQMTIQQMSFLSSTINQKYAIY